jgi:hypothetical protein
LCLDARFLRLKLQLCCCIQPPLCRHALTFTMCML